MTQYSCEGCKGTAGPMGCSVHGPMRLSYGVPPPLTPNVSQSEPPEQQLRREHVMSDRRTGAGTTFCDDCEENWPCPTIRALDAQAEELTKKDREIDRLRINYGGSVRFARQRHEAATRYREALQQIASDDSADDDEDPEFAFCPHVRTARAALTAEKEPTKKEPTKEET